MVGSLTTSVGCMVDKICFVVMPFGEKPIPGVDASFDFDKVFRVIMQPAIRSAGFLPIRADESASSGLIHIDMFRELRDRPVVLVDLSLNNPNVFYELGVRHVMAQRGTVLMCELGTVLPFDVKLSRVIQYKYDGVALDWEEAERVKPQITNALREAASQPDSPVHAMLDRVLPESTAQIEFAMDTSTAYPDKPESLRRYAKTIARTWNGTASVNDLIGEHAGSRMGILSLAEFCLGQAPLPGGADRVAARLRRYAEYGLALELFGKLDQEQQLETWRYMQYGSALSEADPTMSGALEGLKLQMKGLTDAESHYDAMVTQDTRSTYAYCLHYVGAMHERIWQLGDPDDDTHLAAAISHLSRSLEVLGGSPPRWLDFALRDHLMLLYLLRARDGRNDRPDDEGHLTAILRMKVPPEARPATRATVGWYMVIAHTERGDEQTSRTEAVKQLDRDARLEADKSFNRSQMYLRLRQMMTRYSAYQRYPELWRPTAQLLKDASAPSRLGVALEDD